MQSKNSLVFRFVNLLGTIATVLSIVVILYWLSVLTKRDELLGNKNPMENLEAAIRDLPDGNLKSNMFTVLASEYAGSSKELTELLQEYTKIKIKQLQQKDSL